MQNNPNNQNSNAKKENEKKKTAERPSYVVKRSPVLDVFAGVLSVILAVIVWFFVG